MRNLILAFAAGFVGTVCIISASTSKEFTDAFSEGFWNNFELELERVRIETNA